MKIKDFIKKLKDCFSKIIKPKKRVKISSCIFIKLISVYKKIKNYIIFFKKKTLKFFPSNELRLFFFFFNKDTFSNKKYSLRTFTPLFYKKIINTYAHIRKSISLKTKNMAGFFFKAKNILKKLNKVYFQYKISYFNAYNFIKKTSFLQFKLHKSYNHLIIKFINSFIFFINNKLFFFFKNFFILLNVFFIIIILIYSNVILYKLIYKYIILVAALYLIASIFLLINKNTNNGSFNSKSKEFWKRSFLIFWSLEFFIFSLFIIYYLVHFNESKYFLSNKFLDEYDSVISNYLIKQSAALTFSLIVGYNFILFKKNNKTILYVFFIIIYTLITYALYLDFQKFIYISNYLSQNYNGIDLQFFNNNGGIYKLFRENVDVCYLITIFFLKFWHFIFIYIYLLFTIRCFYSNKNVGYSLISSNIQNIIILICFNIIIYFIWLYIGIFKPLMEVPVFIEKNNYNSFFSDLIMEFVYILIYISPIFNIIVFFFYKVGVLGGVIFYYLTKYIIIISTVIAFRGVIFNNKLITAALVLLFLLLFLILKTLLYFFYVMVFFFFQVGILGGISFYYFTKYILIISIVVVFRDVIFSNKLRPFVLALLILLSFLIIKILILLFNVMMVFSFIVGVLFGAVFCYLSKYIFIISIVVVFRDVIFSNKLRPFVLALLILLSFLIIKVLILLFNIMMVFSFIVGVLFGAVFCYLSKYILIISIVVVFRDVIFSNKLRPFVLALLILLSFLIIKVLLVLYCLILCLCKIILALIMCTLPVSLIAITYYIIKNIYISKLINETRGIVFRNKIRFTISTVSILKVGCVIEAMSLISYTGIELSTPSWFNYIVIIYAMVITYYATGDIFIYKLFTTLKKFILRNKVILYKLITPILRNKVRSIILVMLILFKETVIEFLSVLEYISIMLNIPNWICFIAFALVIVILYYITNDDVINKKFIAIKKIILRNKVILYKLVTLILRNKVRSIILVMLILFKETVIEFLSVLEYISIMLNIPNWVCFIAFALVIVILYYITNDGVINKKFIAIKKIILRNKVILYKLVTPILRNKVRSIILVMLILFKETVIEFLSVLEYISIMLNIPNWVCFIAFALVIVILYYITNDDVINKKFIAIKKIILRNKVILYKLVTLILRNKVRSIILVMLILFKETVIEFLSVLEYISIMLNIPNWICFIAFALVIVILYYITNDDVINKKFIAIKKIILRNKVILYKLVTPILRNKVRSIILVMLILFKETVIEFLSVLEYISIMLNIPNWICFIAFALVIVILYYITNDGVINKKFIAIKKIILRNKVILYKLVTPILRNKVRPIILVMLILFKETVIEFLSVLEYISIMLNIPNWVCFIAFALVIVILYYITNDDVINKKFIAIKKIILRNKVILYKLVTPILRNKVRSIILVMLILFKETVIEFLSVLEYISIMLNIPNWICFIAFALVIVILYYITNDDVINKKFIAIKKIILRNKVILYKLVTPILRNKVRSIILVMLILFKETVIEFLSVLEYISIMLNIPNWVCFIAFALVIVILYYITNDDVINKKFIAIKKIILRNKVILYKLVTPILRNKVRSIILVMLILFKETVIEFLSVLEYISIMLNIPNWICFIAFALVIVILYYITNDGVINKKFIAIKKIILCK